MSSQETPERYDFDTDEVVVDEPGTDEVMTDEPDADEDMEADPEHKLLPDILDVIWEEGEDAYAQALGWQNSPLRDTPE